jgi:UDP-N-acetylglucosamine 2-epimerase
MTVLSIVGVRPQFVKAATVSRALAASGIKDAIVHSGQHYDTNMSQVFFDELDLPAPVRCLGINSDSNARQIGRMLVAIEDTLRELQPKMVIVYGDTNTTLAAALAANTLHIPVAHVEAGLRSFNREMPEELNRVLTDHCSSLLFCPTQTAVGQLEIEGVTHGVHMVGDVMYDEVLRSLTLAADRSRIHATLGLGAGGYTLVTIHRAHSTDDAAVLTRLVEGLCRLEGPVVFPAHPRTKARLDANPELLAALGRAGVRVIEPVGYLDMLMLEQGACTIFTDSGGVQKEAYFLQVPCITLREETEWPETVDAGWNVLVGSDPDEMERAAANPPRGRAGRSELFGDGNAAGKIAAIVAESL